jgi:hypothetical protein
LSRAAAPVRRAALLAALLPALVVSAARAEEPDSDLLAEPAPAAPPYDKAGIQSDTAHWIGYQLAGMAAVALASHGDDNSPHGIGFQRWHYNVTHPHWDSDPAVVNYVLHPYWGASYYIRARERGLGKGSSFWYSTLLSAFWEYGAEAMVEQVSYQDLVVTPVIGSLLGEFIFSPLRDHIRAKDGPLDRMDQLALVLTDPLGAINSAVDRTFGVESQLSIAPQSLAGGADRRLGQFGPFGRMAGDPRTARAARGWGLQLRIVW